MHFSLHIILTVSRKYIINDSGIYFLPANLKKNKIKSVSTKKTELGLNLTLKIMYLNHLNANFFFFFKSNFKIKNVKYNIGIFLKTIQNAF